MNQSLDVTITHRPEDERVLSALRSENARLRAEVEALEQYRRLAYMDPLTGLRNRRSLEERLREEQQRASRRPEAVFSVLVFDVNDFKHINDAHGHVVGDACLRFVASTLEQSLRDHDICCRTGGDEFTALLPECDAEGAARLMRRLQGTFHAANAQRVIPVQLSVGSATWSEACDDTQALLNAADQAMYRDKAQTKRHQRPDAQALSRAGAVRVRRTCVTSPAGRLRRLLVHGAPEAERPQSGPQSPRKTRPTPALVMALVSAASDALP
jgi:diguanylate cyclase (GGDEF)-like protein